MIEPDLPDPFDGIAVDDPPEVPLDDTPAPAPRALPSADDAELAALVQRVVGQDEAALGELYRRLSSRVYRTASRLVRDIGTAEEVVEDVFWQVWRQAPRFDAARGPVTAWVMQIARSRALDALRASARQPLLAALELDGESPLPAADDADPQVRAERDRLAASVQQALAMLEPLRRQLVSLAYERGFSQAEIADQTGLPLGTVKSHLRRALATMKVSLEQMLALPGERAK